MGKSTSMPMVKDVARPLKIKPTSPPIKTKPIGVKVPESTGKQKTPLHARRVWNKVRPHKAAASKISRFSDGGQKQYNQKPHLAPGVTKNAATQQGYLPPGAQTGLKRGVADYGKGVTTTYPPSDHAGAGYD